MTANLRITMSIAFALTLCTFVTMQCAETNDRGAAKSHSAITGNEEKEQIKVVPKGNIVIRQLPNKADSNVTMSYPPKVLLPTVPIYVREGSNVTLPVCHVTGYPAPKVTWSKLMSSLPANRVLVKENKLKIISATRDDSGWYVCAASNLYGSSMAIVRMYVVEVQFTITPPLKVQRYAGETFWLKCRAGGDSPLKVTWRKDGQLLFTSSRMYTYGGYLRISRLKSNDGGKYMCTAEIGGMVAIATVTTVTIRNEGLHFPHASSSNYIKIRRSFSSVSTLTVCAWLKIMPDTPHHDLRTLMSYAVHGSDNEIIFHIYGSVVFVINSATWVSHVPVRDGKWHHICITWDSTDGKIELYKNGGLKTHGVLKKGHVIRGGGIMIIGQEQDSFGGSFKASQSYVGHMTGLNIWNRVLGPSEISGVSKSCIDGSGNVLTWRDVISGTIFGTGLKVVTPSGCHVN